MEQLSSTGRFIGEGNTAQVYQYDNQFVVKLYAERFGRDLALYEQGVLSAVNRAGAPSPVVDDMVQYGDRFGLKMEFIDGLTLDKILVGAPGQLISYARLMASLHAGIHAAVTNELQTQHVALYNSINNNKATLGDFTGDVLRYLETLPAGNHVCHGDFHPKNILVSVKKNTVIDWTNAYRGNPLSDVALTRLRLLSPYIPKSFTGDAATFIVAKKAIYEAYLDEYTNLTGIDEIDLEAWLLPCAAAQLHALKTVHTAWLLSIITRQLKNAGL
jgi:tRNA A-37 threonylcarbamoyl transferase component Bud32